MKAATAAPAAAPADTIGLPIAYADARQRGRANHLGMWTFIASEVLFFGGLFLAYFIYRHAYPAAFAAGSHRLNFWKGAVNTAVLLTSSLAMAWGDAFIKAGRRGALQACLAATVVIGVVFLALKGSEYREMYAQHLVPGLNFDARVGPQVELFIWMYFVMTGVHAVHMLVGLGLMGWLMVLNRRGRFNHARHAPIELFGLYWHFVDCIWVFLYPLLYLVGR